MERKAMAGYPVRLDPECPPHIVRLVNDDGSGIELNLKTNELRMLPVQYDLREPWARKPKRSDWP